MSEIFVWSFAFIMSALSFIGGVFVGFKKGYFIGLKDGTVAGIMSRVFRAAKDEHEKA